MPKRKSQPRDSAPGPSERVVLRVLLAIAFCISAYLAWNSLQGGSVPGCGPESDCDKVLSSRWAYLAGLPVSLLALPVYLATVVLLFQKTVHWKAVLPFALLILMSALWFAGLQAFALRAFCKFCMAAHVAGALAALMLLAKNPLPANVTLRFVGMAAVPIALLVVAQVNSSGPGPVQFVSTMSTNAPMPTSQSSNNSLAAGTTNTLAPPAPSGPTFSFVDGEFTLNLNQVPVSGRLDAPKKMVKLFDYTCHHCRDLHHLLKPAKQKYANELAVISLPMPLDSNCNRVMKRTASAHLNACEYAKMALAVFLANPEKFEGYSDWLFAPDHPPEVAAARAHAEGLVGKEAFAAALNDPRVEQQIRTDVEIYVASSQKAKNSAMPQLLFAQGGSIGAVRDAAVLDRILQEALGLAAAPATNAPPTK